MLLAAFEPASKELAIFYIIAVACSSSPRSPATSVAAAPRIGRARRASGLPSSCTSRTMWNQVDAAF